MSGFNVDLPIFQSARSFLDHDIPARCTFENLHSDATILSRHFVGSNFSVPGVIDNVRRRVESRFINKTV